MTEARRVLLAGYFDWEAPLHLGTHNLASAFATAGWDVAYVSTAVSPVQGLRDFRDFRSRLGRFSRGGSTPCAGLWTFMPFAFVTPHNVPILRERAVHRNWQRTTLPNVMRQVRARGFESVSILYMDNPLQKFWLDEVSHQVSVARITDRNSGYVGSAPQLAVMERELVHSVDLVAHSSAVVGDELRADGVENLLYLPNGVDVEHFLTGSRRVPPELEGLQPPIAIYVGTLDEWFDYETVNHAARALPEVSFVIIGPRQRSGPRFEDLPNLHVLGARPFASLPGYLHNSHIGLLPRNTRTRSRLVEAMHPLKLYEYLACGLPVVATRWRELETMRSPAVLCESPDDFVKGIRDVLRDPSGASERVAYARAASWAKRLELLLHRLGMAEG